jgi:NADH-quinone oxidoreductase subunit G
MPTITVDGETIEAKDGQLILQACLDAGLELPHYCYHPGLSVVASCRICLAEVEGAPKLLPTCQTPVRDGMVVHTKSPRAIANQKQVMEYLLVNHPLDCPVCDQAGECYLQDYSYQYGRSESRFEEEKGKKPKKIVGEHVLLYNDRCIMCTRCVRFTREVSGEGELMVKGRGSTEEIDIYPGKPLDNKLSGNVTDLCPVGALLDRDFLFQQRVWLLKNARSISPADAGGENIYLQHNEGKIYRIKPRYNPDVNEWWISDDTRYSYKIVHHPDRLRVAAMKDKGILEPAAAGDALDAAIHGLKQAVESHGNGSLYAVLSPNLASEEAYLLGLLIRQLDSQATLVLGPVPIIDDEVFKHYITGEETFRIQGEKVPNRRGIERVLKLLGGNTATFAELADKPNLKAGWITGNYLDRWITSESLPAVMKDGFTIVTETLPNAATETADVVLPASTFAEKHGSWENFEAKVQAFEPAIDPLPGTHVEGEIFARLLDRDRYDDSAIRAELAERDRHFADADLPHEAEQTSETFEFAEL